MRRIFWTWDIRMRWTHGFCFWSESYLENYRRLIDVSAALGVEGIIIWGFLRDVHGGIDSAKKLVEYANKRNVKIYPGIGIDDYGGIYCEGDSHYSLDTFLKSHPEMQAIRADGSPDVHLWPPNDFVPKRKACPSCLELIPYYQESIEWLLKTFDLSGFQIEQGDSGVCCCEKCRELKRIKCDDAPGADPRTSAVRIPAVLEPVLAKHPDLTVICETYCGLTAETLQRLGSVLDLYPEQVILSWQLYNGANTAEGKPLLKLDPHIRNPRKTGNAALRTNNDLFLGEHEETEAIKNALQLSEKAGLTMTYFYGEYPWDWHITRKNYLAWAGKEENSLEI